MPVKPKFNIPGNLLSGDTTDIYFARTVEILAKENQNPETVMEVFTTRPGILCGLSEAVELLQAVLPAGEGEIWALEDGDQISAKEVVMRIKAPYLSFGLYETVYLGMLASGTGWATAARECVEAAGDIPVTSFGARHIHPLVAGRMDYAAMIGGCKGCSSIEGARLWGISPSGTIPHSLILVMGDTLKATLAFDKHMPPQVPRVALVDTFKDEVEESLRVAEAMGQRLDSVRLDTPFERGRVTADLVKEVRANLDMAGHNHVKIFVSGGLNPERIRYFAENNAPVDGYGTGSYISGARPIDFTADLHEIAGKAIAKRGRIPGLSQNPRLKKVR